MCVCLTELHGGSGIYRDPTWWGSSQTFQHSSRWGLWRDTEQETRGHMKAKAGKREQEGQVKKDEVSTNRKQPHGLSASSILCGDKPATPLPGKYSTELKWDKWSSFHSSTGGKVGLLGRGERSRVDGLVEGREHGMCQGEIFTEVRGQLIDQQMFLSFRI